MSEQIIKTTPALKIPVRALYFPRQGFVLAACPARQAAVLARMKSMQGPTGQRKSLPPGEGYPQKNRGIRKGEAFASPSDCQRTPAFSARKLGFCCNLDGNEQISVRKWSHPNSIGPAFSDSWQQI